MLDAMRKPLFVVSLIAILLAVLVELGSIAFVSQNVNAANSLNVSLTGKAIPAMAFLDGLVLFATTIIGIALLIPERVQSRGSGYSDSHLLDPAPLGHNHYSIQRSYLACPYGKPANGAAVRNARLFRFVVTFRYKHRLRSAQPHHVAQYLFRRLPCLRSTAIPPK